MYDLQLLQELSQAPCTAGINYAKKNCIVKRNRYKNKFPGESPTTAVYELPLNVCMYMYVRTLLL